VENFLTSKRIKTPALKLFAKQLALSAFDLAKNHLSNHGVVF